MNEQPEVQFIVIRCDDGQTNSLFATGATGRQAVSQSADGLLLPLP